MGRLQTFQLLTAEQNAAADTIIRAHRYMQIAVVRQKLADAGFVIGRSTLHRYMRQLKQRDLGCMPADARTLVTIVDRAAGHVVALATTASPEEVASLISTGAVAVPVLS
ncbi:MAG: DUF3486 family protein [Roseateles sp.]|nr:MAG: DUF3486 family protein [Roseateles sp.]